MERRKKNPVQEFKTLKDARKRYKEERGRKRADVKLQKKSKVCSKGSARKI